MTSRIRACRLLLSLASFLSFGGGKTVFLAASARDWLPPRGPHAALTQRPFRSVNFWRRLP